MKKTPSSSPNRPKLHLVRQTKPSVRESPRKESSTLGKTRFAIGLATMATIVVALIATRQERAEKEESVSVSAQKPDPVRVEKVSTSNVTLPEFDISDGLSVNPFVKNPGIPKEQLSELSKAMVEEIRHAIINYVTPELQKRPSEKRSIIVGFMLDIGRNMGGMHPGIAVEVNAIMQNQDRDMTYRLMRYINSYLLDQGYYLSVIMGENEDELNLYPVHAKKTVTVRDAKGEEKVAALYLSKGLLPEIGGGKKGFAPPPFGDHVLIFSHNIKGPASDGILEYYRKNNFAPPATAEMLEQDMEDDIVRHETTHVLLARRFPKAERKMLDGKPFVFNASVAIPGGSGAQMQINGTFAPTTPTELAAWGVQIGRSKSVIPYGHLVNFTDRVWPEYQLVERFLPIITLHAAPDSPLKAKIVQDSMRGSVNFDDFRRLVTDPSFPHAAVNISGAAIYERGYRMIEDLNQ